jgi:hypothetical protein
MVMPADRAIFLEHIIENPLTISQIQETFGVAYATARNWSKHSEVEHIPGTYPHVFRRKTSLAIPGVSNKLGKKRSANGKSVELPDVPENQVQALFEQLMGDEAPAFYFNEEFRAVDSIAAIDKVRNKLITCLIVTDHYKNMMIRDGVV